MYRDTNCVEGELLEGIKSPFEKVTNVVKKTTGTLKKIKRHQE